MWLIMRERAHGYCLLYLTIVDNVDCDDVNIDDDALSLAADCMTIGIALCTTHSAIDRG